MRIGPWELILILLAILLLFGPKRLPDLARSMGAAIKEFRKAAKEVKDEIEQTAEAADTKK